jgi:hypothetical protein
MGYALADCEWFAIRPTLRDKYHGLSRDDRCVLNGMLHSGAHGGACPEAFSRISTTVIALFAGNGPVFCIITPRTSISSRLA